jgi:hypothetical protein
VPPSVPILSQLDPVHAPTSHFLKIHITIILLSTSWSPKWYISFRFPYQIPVFFLLHSCYVPGLLILLDSIARIIFLEQYKSRSSSICIFLQSPVSPFCGPRRPPESEEGKAPAPADTTYIGYRTERFECMDCRTATGQQVRSVKAVEW